MWEHLACITLKSTSVLTYLGSFVNFSLLNYQSLKKCWFEIRLRLGRTPILMLPLSVLHNAQMTLYCSAIRSPGRGASPPSWQPWPGVGACPRCRALIGHSPPSTGLSLVRARRWRGPALGSGFLCTHFGGGRGSDSRRVLLAWQVWWENDVNWRGTDVYDGSCLLTAPVPPPGHCQAPGHLTDAATARSCLLSASRSVLILAEIWLNMNKICSGPHQAGITPGARTHQQHNADHTRK